MAKTTNNAICADCGTKFELPFTPTSNKPVYCNDCFKNKRKPDRRDQRGGRGGGRDNRRGPRQMFSAVCDKCGKKCEVPFRPTEGKPIYCDNCFSKERGNAPKGGNQMQEINTKLDKIIEALIAAKIIKPAKEKKAPMAKKEPAKKTASKKPAAKKKAPAKKTSKKKK